MSICKIFKFVFFTKGCQTERKNSTNELPVEFFIETMLFVAKITALKFSPFLPGSLRFMS